MMVVRVRSFFDLKRAMGSGEVLLRLKEGASVKDLIQVLVERYGEKLKDFLFKEGEKVNTSISIYVNGRLIDFLDGLETKLSDGDVVSLMPPAGGG